MMKTCLLAAAMLVLTTSYAQAETYTIDSRHTFPSFAISHMGFSTQRGRFDKTSGTVEWDKAAGTGKIDITVDAASISTGLAELEEHLHGEDFFDVARYPQIKFTSDQLTFKDDELVAVNGKLTMHGKTQPIDLNVDHFHCGLHIKLLKQVCGANLTGTLKRSDFGVDKYAPVLADEVKLEIQVEAIKN